MEDRKLRSAYEAKVAERKPSTAAAAGSSR